jgi:hypothetical protein
MNFSYSLWWLVAGFVGVNALAVFLLFVAPLLIDWNTVEVRASHFRFGYGRSGWVIQDIENHKLYAAGWWPWHPRSLMD